MASHHLNALAVLCGRLWMESGRGNTGRRAHSLSRRAAIFGIHWSARQATALAEVAELAWKETGCSHQTVANSR